MDMTMTSGVPAIDGHTRIFGIIGRPVGHSLSPAMHNAAFRELGLNAVYVAFPAANLKAAVEGVRGLNIAGLSVTIPFKADIIVLLDQVDHQAARMGAVNTVVNRGGRLTGYNTDWLGARAALAAQTSLAGEHALILGAGGAARAIVYAIVQAGGRVSVTDVDEYRAAALGRDFPVAAIPPAALADCDAGLLINATPVGMAPEVDGIPLAPELLGRYRLVMDIVYRPLETRLLREARARGCQTIDGLQMLIHQATEQFLLFTGQAAPLAAMSQAAYAALAATP
jgi:shikimate dehydrogenase